MTMSVTASTKTDVRWLASAAGMAAAVRTGTFSSASSSWSLACAPRLSWPHLSLHARCLHAWMLCPAPSHAMPVIVTASTKTADEDLASAARWLPAV